MFRRRRQRLHRFPFFRQHGTRRTRATARKLIAVEPLEERRLLTAVRQLAGFGDNALDRGNDVSSDVVDLGFEIDYFGDSQDELFVNTNGAVTFGGALPAWAPQPLSSLKRDIIAPFWADVDTTPDTTGLVTYGTDTVDGRSALGVNWIDVGSFDQNETPTNSFQLIIIDRGDMGAGAFDLEFNYDQVLWDTADGSTAERPAARAGFSTARGFGGTFYELVGSATDGAFLDSNQTVGLASHSLQSTESGRYVFEFRGGSPLDEFGLAGQTVEVAPGFVFLGSGLSADEILTERPTNVDAADTTNTDQIQVGGNLNLDLTGAGLTVGVWEAGGNSSYVRTTHQELNGRVTVVDDGAPTFSNHATHVAGTIAAAGINGAAQGMATAVNLLSYSSAGAAAEMAAAAAGIVASNHSYGIDEGWSTRANIMSLAGMNFDTWLGDRAVFAVEDPGHGKYTANSVAMDNVIANNPGLLSVFSAGNERNDTFGNRLGTNQYVSFFSVAPAAGVDLAPVDPGWWLVTNAGATAAPPGDGNGGTGFDSITSTQTAKNILTVGAIQDVTVDPITGVTLANHSAFSSYGPTDDGRIKPDIVGNGVGLFSSTASSDSDYSTFDGTSMAAPNLTGTATLLIEHHMNLFGSQPTAARTKGVLLHNAFDAGNVGPDYSFGWGLADAAASAEFLNSVQDPVKGRLDVLLDRTYTGDTLDFTFNVTSGRPLKATIVWTDPAGNPHAAGLDIGTPALVNDLDLTIIGPGGVVFDPWTLDPTNPANPAVRTTRNAVDNVEQVLIDAPASGTYTIRVNHTGGIQEESQNFTLLVSGAFFAPDQFENNNSLEDATILGSVPEIILRDLTIHDEDDEDWFKVTANSTGKLIINALFTDADGDIDITVVDMNNNLLGSSTSTTDNERIVIPVVSQEMYFILVTGFGDDTNCYDLEIENFPVPVPSGVHLDPASDTGMMNNDNYTADNTPRLIIQADLTDFADMGIVIRDAAGAAAMFPGAAVEVFVTNSTTGVTVSGFADPIGASTTLFEFTPPAALGDGVYFVSAAVRIFDGQRDDAGVLIPDISRRGQLSEPLWFTVDTLAPEPATKDLIDSSDTGMLNDDNVTNKMRPAFAGVAEPNAKIRVLAGGQVVGNGLVTSAGTWEITVEPLADGEYAISTEVEDLAGNTTLSNGLTIWVDTTEPNTPLLDLVTEFDFGHSDTDNITNTGTPTLTVTADDTPNGGLNPFPNDIKYRIFDRPGNALGEILLVDSFTGIPGFTTGGLFAHTLSQLLNDDFDGVINGVPLADGVHNFKLEVEDRAGNISHDFLLNVEIDTVAPVANTPNLLDSSDTGMLGDDDVTNKMSPAFDGISEVNSAVRVFANGVLVGQGVVASDASDGVLGDDMGLWEVTVEPLADGEYVITVEIEDWAGNATLSEGLTIWIDTVAPNTPLLDLVSDSGRHDADNVTNVNTPMVTVTADDTPDGGLNPFPNDIKYRIYDRPGNALGEVLLVDSFAGIPGFTAGGLFAHTLSQLLNDDFNGVINGAPLADGVHNLKLEVEDRAGNISHDFLLEITIDTVAPVATITGIDPSNTDTGVEGQAATFADLITSDTATGFVGLAEADSIVRMWADGHPISDGVITASDVFQGLTVAIPLDGNLAFPDGQWNLAGQFDLNDPTAGFPLDGTRQISVTAEDLAGNVGELDTLDIFIDTQGPRVANVSLPDDPLTVENEALFDLFDPKPSAGPTPLVHRLNIKFSDLPIRTQQFLYAAVNQQVATTVGNYQLVGDQVGHILIESILFEDMTVAGVEGDDDGEVAVENIIAGMPAMSTVTLVFADPLPDDRYTLLVRDSIVDDAGNALDGESQVASPDDNPVFPSGDGQPGGDFLARFTVDSRPEIGTFCCGSVYIDINGNKIFDPEGQDNDRTNRDLVFAFGNSADALFAGQFTNGGAANGFDRLGAYGFDGVYRFLLDLNDDGVADVNIASAAQVNAAPIAGNFDGNAANGDEIGLFTGTQWYLDQVHANNVPAAPTIAGGNMRGYPIAGDFDGNGTDDLATFFGDTFYFDFNLDGNADATIAFGFAGVLDRPVAADLDQDGIDDIGLWVPGRSGVFPEEAGEFYFLMSNDPAGVNRVPGTVNTLNHPFSPFPLGVDMFAQFGDEFASPIVGNFDPPVAGGNSGGGTGTPLQPPVVDQSGWIQSLYSDVAGRAAQENEVAYWNGQMAAGMSQQAVANSLLAGPEYRGRVIDSLYQDYLGRRAEAAGLSYWLDIWADHGGPEIVKASLFGSAEYYANHGGTDTGFVQGLYQDVLGRSANASEVAYWQSTLTATSRTAVAMGFVTSDELRLAAINSWYQEFLSRDVDHASQAFWLNQLRLGASQQQALASILGSAEYRNS